MKSYRDFLKENIKESQHELQYIPVGGFYPDQKLSALVSKYREADGDEKYGEAKRRLPSPVLYDRYDIAYLYQFPPAFHSQALHYRYSDMLFDAKRMQMEGQDIPEMWPVTLDWKGTPITFRVFPNAGRLLKKLEGSFAVDDVMGKSQTLSDKSEFAQKMHDQDDWMWNNKLDPGKNDSHNWFDPAYAAHGYDLTPTATYDIENPGKRDKSQSFGENFIGLTKKRATEHLNRWRTGAVTGWNRGNPMRNAAIYGDPSNFLIQPVSYSGGKGTRRALVGLDGQVHEGTSQGVAMPVFTDGGMKFALQLMQAHGVQGIDSGLSNIDHGLFPFELRNDGAVRWNAYAENGDPLREDMSILTSQIPILMEGELIDARDWGRAFGKFEQKPDDPTPIMDQITELHKNGDPRAEQMIGEFLELGNNAGRYDWFDHLLFFSNIAKTYPKPEDDPEGKGRWDMPLSITGKRIKDPDAVIMGGGNMFKGEKWCWPPEDKSTFDVIRNLVEGEIESGKDLAQAVDELRKDGGAAAVGVRKQMLEIAKTIEGKAMKLYEPDIVSLASDRLLFCISGHPLIVTYVRIKNGTWTFEEAPWNDKQWQKLNVSIVRPGNEDDPEAMLKDLEKQVYKFLRDKAQSFADTIGQLDWGRGARRMRGKSGGEQKSLDDLKNTVKNAGGGAGQGKAGAEGLPRSAGDRTALREAIPRQIKFAHSLAHIMQRIDELKGEIGKHQTDLDSQIAAMKYEDASDSMLSTIGAAAEMYDKFYMAYMIQQIMQGNSDVSTTEAEKYALEATAAARGSNYKMENDPEPLPERGDATEIKSVADSAAVDLSSFPESMRPGIKILIDQAMKGQVNEEALEAMLDQMEDNNPDLAQEIEMIRQMVLGGNAEQPAAAAKTGAVGPSVGDVSQLMGMFRTSPQKFTQTAVQSVQSNPQLAVTLIKSAASAKSAYGDGWKAALSNVFKTAPQALAQAQKMAQGDQAFAAGLQALGMTPQESVGAGGDAIFDGSKSRDWNWSGSKGSTGVTPKEEPIKSWLKKKKLKT